MLFSGKKVCLSERKGVTYLKEKAYAEKRYVCLKDKVWHIFKDRCFSQDDAEKVCISERKSVSYLKEKAYPGKKVCIFERKSVAYLQR